MKHRLLATASESATAAAQHRASPARSGSAASSASRGLARRDDRRPRRAAPGGLQAGAAPGLRARRARRPRGAARGRPGESSNPSLVAATASSRSRAGVPASARGDQQAEPGQAAPADPAAQLVQLGDAEPVGVEDHHHGGVGDVDADLDHRGGDQHVDLAGGEGAHRARPSRRRAIRPCSTSTRRPASGPSASSAATSSTAASGGATGRRRRRPRRRRARRLALLGLVAADPRAHDVGLVALADLLADPLPGPVEPAPAARRAGRRWSGSAPGRPAARSASRSRGRRRRSSRRCAGSASRSSPARAGGVPALSVSAARCSTPNRCCSSTTTRPRSANCDLLLEQGVGADHDAGLAADAIASSGLGALRPWSASR